MISLSIIVPVYNAEQTLNDLYQQLLPELNKITDDYEIIFVEDCGNDNSWEIIKELSQSDPHVIGIKLSKNYGQHNALLCGIREASNEIIITMDDDLQNPVSEIPKLLAKLSEGYDVVYGYPEKGQHGLLRNLASRITKYTLQSAMGIKTARNVSAFRAFHSRLREAFENFNNPNVSIDVLLTWGTRNFATVKVKHNPRKAGISNYTIKKLITHALNLMTGFSTMPLHIASGLGLIFIIFGFGILTWVIGRYFIEGAVVPGFTFLSSIVTIFSGAQLFALGIIGEYLARIHFRTLDRPTYLIKESVSFVKKN